MLGAYFSPLAPAVVLLLSAFILPVVMPRLPVAWQAHRWIRSYSAPSLVGLAGLTLLGIRLTPGSDVSGEGLELLSGWNFSTTESVAMLTIRADTFSLPFLIVVMLVLLAVTLLRADPASTVADQDNWTQVSSWLAMGAGACLLFISANGLTLVYAVLAFDTLTAVYWLGRRHFDLGVARLLLGGVTGAGLVLATLVPTGGLVSGLFLLGLVLWLRLGLYPYVEGTAHAGWHDDDRLAYLGMTLAVGIYLTIRLVGQPLPESIRWLAVLTMLLSGLLAWLTAAGPVAEENAASTKPEDAKVRPLLLTWLILTQVLLIFLAEPPVAIESTAFAVGLILSLVALWVTPALGRPHFGERAWSWPYLPAVAATLTLIGVPLFLGWPARVVMYQSLNSPGNMTIMIMAILAEGLAFGGLVRYWLILWQGNEVSSRRSVVGVVAMVPFLTPALAPFVLSTITGTDLPVPNLAQPPGVFIPMIAIIVIAAGLGYFRDQIIGRLNVPPEFLVQLLHLHWLLRWGEVLLDRVGKFVLRVQVILEGQYYIGWAIFVALVGTLVVLFS